MNYSTKGLAAMLLFASGVYAQLTPSYTPKMNIPTSPEAQMFTRFGDIPVGYYTGTPQITVPLYTISESGVELPIALNYHASGIKVTDDATWVGLGWDLDPGGTIVQEVRGKKDDADMNLGYFSIPSDYAALKQRFNNLPQGVYNIIKQYGFWGYHFCNPETPPLFPEVGWTSDPELPLVGLAQGEGQPDIYRYSFAGYSGSFYLNPETKNPVMLDQKSYVKITRNSYDWYTATTPDGTKFNFNVVEVAYSANAFDDRAGKTFKLGSIQFANGRSITFSYTNAKSHSQSYSQSASLRFVPGQSSTGPSFYDPILVSTNESDIKVLSKITTEDGEIVFNPGSRIDLAYSGNDTAPLLASIDIKSKQTGKKVKSFVFSYSYFASNSSSADVFRKRLKLESVKEIGYDGVETADNSMKPYVFGYDESDSLPDKSSCAKDFWGYYNGILNNSSLLPDLDYFDYKNDVRYADILNGAIYFLYPKANRYANAAKAQVWTLNKLTYPTGGYTEFVYEPHSFTNQFIPDQSMMNPNSASSLLKSFVDTDYSPTSPPTMRTFTLSRKTTLKFNINYSNGSDYYAVSSGNSGQPGVDYYSFDQMKSGSFVRLEKIVGGTATKVKDWVLEDVATSAQFNNNTFNVVDEVEVPFDPNATYRVLCNFGASTYINISGAGVSCTLQYYDETGVNISTSYGGGLRIKEIKSYTDAGLLASRKGIRYINEDGSSSGLLLGRFEPLSALPAFASTCFGIVNGETPNNVSPFNMVSLNADDFGLSGGGTPIGYSRVEEVNYDITNSSQTAGKKVFVYYNHPNMTSKGLPDIVDGKNGLLINEETWNTSTVLEQKTYLYHSMIGLYEPFRGIILVNHSFGMADNCYPWAPDDEMLPYKYTYNAYPLIRSWYQCERTIKTEYLGSGSIISDENLTFDQYGNVSQKTALTSEGATATTHYFYPDDNYYGNTVENQMVIDGMVSNPIVTQESLDGILLTEQFTQYAQDASTSNRIYPKYVQNRKGTGPNNDDVDENRITIDYYGPKGNIRQYTPANGRPVSFIWGYNDTRIIAKLENVTYFSIPSATINNLVALSNADNDNCRTVGCNEMALRDALNNLRNSLPGALVTTFTYDPLVGVTSITDPKGDPKIFSYDNFGRLSTVRDKYDNILTKNEYNIR